MPHKYVEDNCGKDRFQKRKATYAVHNVMMVMAMPIKLNISALKDEEILKCDNSPCDARSVIYTNSNASVIISVQL